MRLTIDKQWDGGVAQDFEHVTVRLRDEGNGLRVRINGPWHRDAAPPGEPGPTDQLWLHEVVELFIGGPGTDYTEFEVGPYGHYLLLTLSDVRELSAKLLPAEVTVSRDRRGFEARVWISAEHLPDKPWRVNACAIYGKQGPDRRYLSAVALPGDVPDFHQPDAFVPFEKATEPY